MSITNNVLMDESNRDDLVGLLERIGPAIMLTHSRSGPFGWLVADARPDLVHPDPLVAFSEICRADLDQVRRTGV